MSKKPRTSLRDLIRDDPKFLPSVVIGIIVAVEIAIILGLIIANRLEQL